MKKFYITLLLGLASNLYCQHDLTAKKKVLLIKYRESTQCKELSNPKEFDSVDWKNFCDEFLGTVDDFSEFFYNTGKFFAQTNLTLTDNTKLIFWDYDYIRFFDSVPFGYSKIRITSIINDSTIEISYNNKQIILNSRNEISDSIIDFTRTGNRFTYNKTRFVIENIGLIKEENIIDLNKVKFEDTGELLRNLSSNEFKSRYSGGIDSLSSFISNNFCDTIKEKGQIVLRLNINSFGKVKEIQVIRGINSKFDEEMKRVLNLTKWLPSAYNKDFMFTLPLILNK